MLHACQVLHCLGAWISAGPLYIHTKSTTCIYDLRKVRLAPALPERNYEYYVRRGECVRVLQRCFLGFESGIKVRPHRTRSAAADCGLCPLRIVTF